MHVKQIYIFIYDICITFHHSFSLSKQLLYKILVTNLWFGPQRLRALLQIQIHLLWNFFFPFGAFTFFDVQLWGFKPPSYLAIWAQEFFCSLSKSKFFPLQFFNLFGHFFFMCLYYLFIFIVLTVLVFLPWSYKNSSELEYQWSTYKYPAFIQIWLHKQSYNIAWLKTIVHQFCW